MNAPDSRSMVDVQRSMVHLQRCLLALEKIKGIVGPGAVASLCDEAIRNKQQSIGGTVDG